MIKVLAMLLCIVVVTMVLAGGEIPLRQSDVRIQHETTIERDGRQHGHGGHGGKFLGLIHTCILHVHCFIIYSNGTLCLLNCHLRIWLNKSTWSTWW